MIYFALGTVLPIICGRVCKACRISCCAFCSSSPASSSRGGRTRAFPMPASACASLISWTNLGTVSKRSRGRNQRYSSKALFVLTVEGIVEELD